ncbi:hypothetical protein E2C01_073244 [Portunus trituberculatus]|uniref:Uncharacterized protein n=1 Tax=Portunus trituberculatus TaxID=210409 RepID=A0A5B7IB64_PORTR|nr:hypothetical protein [Portunus trituberculatus]
MEGLSGSPEGDGDSEGSVRGGVEGKNNKSGPWTQTPRENAESEANGDEGGEGSPVIRLLVLGGHAVGKSGGQPGGKGRNFSPGISTSSLVEYTDPHVSWGVGTVGQR